MVGANKPVRVLSERIMTRGFEPTVVRLMEKVRVVGWSRSGCLVGTGAGTDEKLCGLSLLQVQQVVKSQPGLLSVETLRDVSDHHKFIMMSEVWCTQRCGCT